MSEREENGEQMRLLIDKTDLELLLEKKREYIGKKVTIDTIIAGVSFLLSAFTASYNDILGISGIVLKTIFCVIGMAYIIKIIFDIIDMYKNKYDHNILAQDIISLNKIQHNHSLIAIKDTFDNESQRFLVYDDERWDCKLFLNYKTSDYDNEAYVTENISADLGIAKRNISCKYITSKVQEKYSVSHNENRIYNHRLYEVTIHKFPEIMKKADFVVNGKHYYWMTIEEMEKDKRIMSVNMDVVDFVKENL